MILLFRWRTKAGQFSSGSSLFLNQIRVGGYSYNAAQSQGENDESKAWVGNIDLPSLKDSAKVVYGKTEEQVKQGIEEMVAKWFAHIEGS